jgi:hypothetical protein
VAIVAVLSGRRGEPESADGGGDGEPNKGLLSAHVSAHGSLLLRCRRSIYAFLRESTTFA